MSYTVKRSRIFQVSPQALAYWVQVTVPSSGNTSFTTNESIETGTFSTLFGLASGSAVFNSSCSSLSATFAQNGGAVTSSFNAPAAGTYYLSIRYSTTTVKNKTAPTPTTVHYNFATTGVSGSTAGVDLLNQ